MRRRKILGAEFWEDDNGNIWNTFTYSEEMARRLSETLVGCSMCIDCSFCSFCVACRNCSNCRHCSRLTNAHNVAGR